MAIEINLKIPLKNREEVVAELNHIAILIEQGYPSGDGWSITGEDEKSEDLTGEFVEDDEEDTMGEDNPMGDISNFI